jgi:hypothetical protein
MTVKELMDILSQLDPESQVVVWNGEFDEKTIVKVDVDEVGDCLIY